MDVLWQKQVQERALAIWQREGSPHGSPDQFNPLAEQELIAEGETPLSNPLAEQPDQSPDERQVDDTHDAIDGLLPTSDPPF
jgi:hypothetical protein